MRKERIKKPLISWIHTRGTHAWPALPPQSRALHSTLLCFAWTMDRAENRKSGPTDGRQCPVRCNCICGIKQHSGNPGSCWWLGRQPAGHDRCGTGRGRLRCARATYCTVRRYRTAKARAEQPSGTTDSVRPTCTDTDQCAVLVSVPPCAQR